MCFFRVYRCLVGFAVYPARSCLIVRVVYVYFACVVCKNVSYRLKSRNVQSMDDSPFTFEFCSVTEFFGNDQKN